MARAMTESRRVNYKSSILASPMPAVACRKCNEDCVWQQNWQGKWYLLNSVPSTSQPGKVMPLFGNPHICTKEG
jgi:hypothetical protein